MTAKDKPAGTVRIGWASRDITPDRPNVLRGQFYARVSEGAADPITVTAMAVESAQGGAQAIVISCDLVAVSEEIQSRAREAVGRRLPGFDTRMLFLHATHTHTAPVLAEGIYPPQDALVMTPTEYAAIFVERVAEAAMHAWEARQPAGVSWAYSHAVVGHNRRATYLDGSSRMYGKTHEDQFDCMEGYEDHGVDLLFTWDARGAMTGAVVNIPCPSQVSEHEKRVSADFWHETRQEIRRRHGGNLFILPQCAAAGDQSPHLLLFKDLEAAMWQRRGVTQRQEIARRIADAVDDAVDGARAAIRTEPVFRHDVETLELPVRMVTREEYELAQAQCAKLEADRRMEASQRFVHVNRNRKVMRRYESQATRTAQPIELHVLRLGDVAMATNPFELFLDFGLRIKARSNAFQTFVVQLACDYCGYLPTARAVRGRSYGAEIASNLVGPEGGQVLVNRTLERIRGLWE